MKKLLCITIIALLFSSCHVTKMAERQDTETSIPSNELTANIQSGENPSAPDLGVEGTPSSAKENALPIFDYTAPSESFLEALNQLDENQLPKLLYTTTWSTEMLQIKEYIVYYTHSWEGYVIKYCTKDGSDYGEIGRLNTDQKFHYVLKMYDKNTLLIASWDSWGDRMKDAPQRSYLFNMVTGEFKQTEAPTNPEDYTREPMLVNESTPWYDVEKLGRYREYVDQKDYTVGFLAGAKDDILVYGIMPDRLIFEDISNGSVIKEVKLEHEHQRLGLNFVVFYEDGVCYHQEDDIGYATIGYIPNDSNEMIILSTNENAFYGYYIFGDWLYLIGYGSGGLHGAPGEVWESARLARVKLTGGEIEWLD